MIIFFFFSNFVTDHGTTNNVRHVRGLIYRFQAGTLRETLVGVSVLTKKIKNLIRIINFKNFIVTDQICTGEIGLYSVPREIGPSTSSSAQPRTRTESGATIRGHRFWRPRGPISPGMEYSNQSTRLNQAPAILYGFTISSR